jgi:hypothetical protein
MALLKEVPPYQGCNERNGPDIEIAWKEGRTMYLGCINVKVQQQIYTVIMERKSKQMGRPKASVIVIAFLYYRLLKKNKNKMCCVEFSPPMAVRALYRH